MKDLIYASTLNIDKVLDSKTEEIRLEKILVLLGCIALAWAYAFTQVIFAYQVIESSGDKLFLWIRSFTFALAFVLIIALITTFFIKKRYAKFTERLYYGLLSQTPVVAVAFLGIFFNITYQYGNETIGLFGFFPEHIFVIAGFFSVFSTLKLVARIVPLLGIIFLFPNLFIHYFFLVAIFYKIFKIY